MYAAERRVNNCDGERGVGTDQSAPVAVWCSPDQESVSMAAIPPIHDDPPVGTGGIVIPEPNETPGRRNAPPPEPGPMPDQGPDLPGDWSPVDPSPPA